MKKILILFYCLLSFGSAFSQLTTTKITELPAASNADSGDVFPFVDISASKTKKITAYNLFYEIDSTIAALNDTVTSLRNANNALVDSIAVLRALLSDTTIVYESVIFVSNTHAGGDTITYPAFQALTLTGGDTVVFFADETFADSFTVKRDTCSGEWGRIVFSKYGSGANPIITSKDSLPGWSDGSNWTSEGGNEWSIPLYYLRPVLRMWVNGSEVMCGIQAGGIDADSVFLHHSDNKLYFYSVTNPAETFTSMEIPSYVGEASLVRYTVSVDNADFVTLENLDIQGGVYGSIGIKGADNLIIQNCDIGKYGGRSGITSNGDGLDGIDTTSDNVIIANNTIFSEWIYPYWAYDASTPYGVFITDGSDWSVYNNTITDWWFGMYIWQDATLVSENHQVYNNNISSPNFSSSKGIQFYSDDNATNGYEMQLDIYNNHIHDVIAGINAGAADNKIYYNVLDSMITGPNEHSYGNSSFSIEINHETPGADLGRNYVFNNTFYKARDEQVLYGDATYFINNLFLEPYESAASFITIKKYSFSSDTVKNNLFFKTGSDSGSYFIQLTANDPDDFYSVNMLNALGGKISGNIYPGQTTYQIMNYDFSLPSGSEALNNGINNDYLLPDGFTDRFGNLVDQAYPNIGASDN